MSGRQRQYAKKARNSTRKENTQRAANGGGVVSDSPVWEHDTNWMLTRARGPHTLQEAFESSD